MKNRIASFLILAIIMVATGTVASAQQAVNIAPDDRFAGYPRSLIEWPPAQPNLKTCQDQEFYEPLDTHLMKYVSRVRVVGERVQEQDECTWMLTRNKWRWVLRPEGTKVATDAQGQDLFDFGSPAGKKCANPRPISIPITPPAPVPPSAPPPVEAPEPLPPTCSISGDRLTGFIGIAVNGEGRWSFNGVEQVGVIDRFTPPSILKPGVHAVEFRVSGPGGSVVCERKFDVFAPLAAPLIARPMTPQPKLETKPRRKLWIGVGIIGIAVGGGVYIATRGEEKKPTPVGIKPPVGVISPARVGFSLRF